jgi:hypothetical protein
MEPGDRIVVNARDAELGAIEFALTIEAVDPYTVTGTDRQGARWTAGYSTAWVAWREGFLP